MLAVSVEPPAVSESLRKRIGVPIRFLSDEQGTLMDVLGIRDRDALPPAFISGRPHEGATRDLFMSTSFLLDEQGVIRWVYRPGTYRVRAPARAVLGSIDALG